LFIVFVLVLCVLVNILSIEAEATYLKENFVTTFIRIIQTQEILSVSILTS